MTAEIGKTWSFDNCTVTCEAYDRDLRAYRVSGCSPYAGRERDWYMLVPQSIRQMEDIEKRLDGGLDPISDGWEDGRGSTVKARFELDAEKEKVLKADADTLYDGGWRVGDIDSDFCVEYDFSCTEARVIALRLAEIEDGE